MTVSRSDFAGAGRGPRKPQPVRGEPQVSPGAPEHLESNAAAAEGYTRTTFGVVDNARDDSSDGFYTCLRRDRAAYLTGLVFVGLVLASVAAGVVLMVRAKPVALDPMPIPRYMTIDCWPVYGVRRTVEIDTKKTDSDEACKH